MEKLRKELDNGKLQWRVTVVEKLYDLIVVVEKLRWRVGDDNDMGMLEKLYHPPIHAKNSREYSVLDRFWLTNSSNNLVVRRNIFY